MMDPHTLMQAIYKTNPGISPGEAWDVYRNLTAGQQAQENNILKAQLATERNQNRLAIAGLEAGNKLQVQGSKNQGAANVAGINAGSRQTVAKTKAQSAKTVAGINAEAKTKAAEIQGQSRAQAALIRAQHATTKKGGVAGLSPKQQAQYKALTTKLVTLNNAVRSLSTAAAMNQELVPDLQAALKNRDQAIENLDKFTASLPANAGQVAPVAPATTPGQAAMIRVISPSGQSGTIPAANLKAAIAEGYKEAP